MNRIVTLLALVILVSSTLFAQTSSKLDLRLAYKIKQLDNQNEFVPLLVKGNANQLQELANRYGGRDFVSYGFAASVKIPAKNVAAFANNKAVLQIENPNVKAFALLDTARMRNNVDSVYAGNAPLSQSYDGSGVVVGIIDIDFYYQHADFKNANGTTRFKYIWDLTDTSHTHSPLPYAYGAEWRSAQIDGGTCGYHSNPNKFSHGTNVTSIAAGNGNADSGKYRGIAPKADIIGAVINEASSNFSADLMNAVGYIFSKADSMGKPCVINISSGVYSGSHDGRDIVSQYIDSMLAAKKGRVVVAAGGNEGNIPFHLSYPIPADSAYTAFNYLPSYGVAYFEFWADTANFNRHSLFTVGANNIVTGNNVARLPYVNAPDTFHPTAAGINKTWLLDSAGVLIGRINIQINLVNTTYYVQIQVDSTNANYVWRLQTSGQGTFDCWAHLQLVGTSGFVSPVPAGLATAQYRYPDTLKTIVSGWQCSDRVITVGNYVNRAGYLDYTGTHQDGLNGGVDAVGRKATTSSLGPTRDNRIKPDIMATGNTTLAAADSNDFVISVGAGNGFKFAAGGKYKRNGGTSMASPVVAGIAALYLQKHPTASYKEVKQVLICTAKKDSFTTNIANSRYGNGKVNGFRALASVIGSIDTVCHNYNPLATCDTGVLCVAKVYGCTDTGSINYNAAANTNNGSCIAKVYGCTDSTARNYNRRANVNNGSCIYTGINSIPAYEPVVTVMPNPFSGQTVFKLDLANTNHSAKAILILTNELGQSMDEIPLNNNQTELVYTNTKLSSGVYFYHLQLDQIHYKAAKLVIY